MDLASVGAKPMTFEFSAKIIDMVNPTGEGNIQVSPQNVI